MGAVSQLMGKLGVRMRRDQTEIHRDPGVVERFNSTLAERLFGYQYAKELENAHKRNREYDKRLPEVIKALNTETKKHPPFVTKKAGASICLHVNVRYLYQPGELKGGGKRRTTDPIWSLD